MRKKTQKGHPTKEQMVAMQLFLPLANLIRGDLHDFVVTVGMKAFQFLLEQDRTEICGQAYERNRGDLPLRSGTAPSSIPFGGRKVSLDRPRVRHKGTEITLPTWDWFAEKDRLDARALEQMMLGISTRDYAHSLEPVPETLHSHGDRKSTVSRRFVAMTKAQLDHWLMSDLSLHHLSVIMVDGIHISDHVILVALGIDQGARKHVLGLWEGATENREACMGLLRNLADRGLRTDSSYLFVIDGSPALRKAIRDMFGKRALVQRCQHHKIENVLSHLPKKMHSSVGQSMRQAYRSRSYSVAKRQLNALVNRLDEEHPSAARSLREGLEETLTIIPMKLEYSLQRTLATTNPIENLNGGIRELTVNVKRWRSGTMIMRWVSAALLKKQKGFRRLHGYKSMPRLVEALRRNDATLDNHIDSQDMAA